MWDDLLRRSGAEIATLAQGLAKVEEGQSKVGQVLDWVEGQQSDLEGLLGGYEQQLEGLRESALAANEASSGARGFGASVNRGGTPGLRGGELERERMYAQAERLDANLGDLAASLTAIINDVNSSLGSGHTTTSKDTAAAGSGIPSLPGSNGAAANGEEDAVEQIVAILNAHLNSLRWIDGAVKALRGRIGALRRGVIE